MNPAVRRFAEAFRHPVLQASLMGVAVAALHAVVRLSDAVAVGAFNDDGVYVALGRALADGEGYRSLYAPGAPVHVKYPPGLPLVLAALWKIGGSLEVVARAHGGLMLLVNGIAAALVWWLARRELDLTLAFAAIFALGPFFTEMAVEYFHLPLSDPYFVGIWAAALVTYATLRRRRERLGTDHEPWVAALVLGLLVALATLFRTQGVVLVLALGIALLMDRFRRRTVTAYAVSALGPLVIWSVVHQAMVAVGPLSTQPDEAPYTSWITVGTPWEMAAFVWRAVVLNWTWYWRGMPGNFADQWLSGVLILVVLALALAGGLVREFPRRPALALSLAGTIALLAVWPWPQDRFVAAFLPLAGLLAGRGTQLALGRCRRALQAAGYATLVVLVGSIAARQVEIRRSAYWPTNPQEVLGVTSPGFTLLSNTRFLVSVARWTLANTRRDDRIMVFSPAALFLYTRRQAVAGSPAESRIGPSVFDTPGRYLARRTLEDGVTVVVGGSPQIEGELTAVRHRCPASVTFAGTSEGWAEVRMFRIGRDEVCLRSVLDGS